MSKGFTLLEIIVVLMMIGILTGIAVATLKFDRGEQQLSDTADAFIQYYYAAQDEALLSGKPIQLTLHQQKWQLSQRQQGSWENTNLDQPPPTLPENTTLQITPKKPLFLLSSGQATPFTLTLQHQAFQKIIRGDSLGRLSLETP